MATKKKAKNSVEQFKDAVTKASTKVFDAAYAAEKAATQAMAAAEDLDAAAANLEEDLDILVATFKNLGIELPKAGGEAA